MKSLLCNISVKPILEFVVKNKVKELIFDKIKVCDLKEKIILNTYAGSARNIYKVNDNIRIIFDKIFYNGHESEIDTMLKHFIEFLEKCDTYINKHKEYEIIVSSGNVNYYFIDFNKLNDDLICRFRYNIKYKNFKYINFKHKDVSYEDIENGLKLLDY